MTIQLRKRTPFDLGPILGIEPFVMAKAAACFLSASARRSVQKPDLEQARILVRAMHDSRGCLGEGAWGYEFDVQTRWGYYPAGSPNLIATFFCGRALVEAGIAYDVDEWYSEGLASAEFLVRSHLKSGRRGYFKYISSSDALIHNANLLGAGFVCAMGALCGRDDLVDAAVQASQASLGAQQNDGSWMYGEGTSLGWCDNFHTAYNLDGLSLLHLGSGEAIYYTAADRGAQFWRKALFREERIPMNSVGVRWPVDIHACGTSIDVAAKLAGIGIECLDLSKNVLEWTLANMFDEATGRTYFQMRRWGTDRRWFVRWGDAQLAMGRASHDVVAEGLGTVLEEALRRRSASVHGAGGHP